MNGVRGEERIPIDIYELEQKIIDVFINQSINEIRPV